MRVPENFGDQDYLEQIDSLLRELDHLRSQMGRMERKERFTISRAMESIKSIRRRAERYHQKKEMLGEDYLRIACAAILVESVLLKKS